MSNSIAPGSSADVNVKVTALTTNPNVPVSYKTIILKKNLVNGVNTLTQEMMSIKNTKYVIKYDYILGENITVPNNCILEFDGGSISASGSNDNITGANTGISAGLVKIFNTDVFLAGSWNVSEAYPEWFGAVGDGTTEDTLALTSVISFGIQGVTIKLSNKIYLTDRQIIANCGNLKIVGDSGSTIKLKTLKNGGNILQIEDGNTIYLDNIIFDGNSNKALDPGGNLVQTNGNMFSNTVINCTFKDFNASASTNALGGAGDFFIDNCHFLNCATGPYFTTGTIQNCVIEECGWGLQLFTCHEFRVANNRFINNLGDICLRNSYVTDWNTGTIVGNTFVSSKTPNDRPSIQIANPYPRTTKDSSVVINSNVFDIQTTVIWFGEGLNNEEFTCNNVIFSNNVIKNCNNFIDANGANNILITDNIVSSTGGAINIYGEVKDIIIDKLIFTYKSNSSINFIFIQGKYLQSGWKIDNFTLKNFKIRGADSGYWLYYYNEANISQDSIINIENDKDSFPFNPQFIIGGYQQDVLNNLIYWKYIPGNEYITLYGVRKSFAIGKPFLFNNKLYYWNGTEHKEM